MVRQLTTRAQVNGYRFLLRRLEHALVRRDVRLLHDPMRAQMRALAIGTVLTMVALAGFGIWGLIRPQGSVGDAHILVSKDSGGLYVLVDDVVHPVLNLASARLITGTDERPRSVADSRLAGYPRGPLLGIPGAPVGIAPSAHPGTSTWTVCDRVTGRQSVESVVIADHAHPGASIRGAGRDEALFVTDGAEDFLIYLIERGDGLVPVRAEVDTDSVAVLRAFGLEDHTPRPVTAGLLNTFPEVDELTPPDIPGAGRTVDLVPGGARVGSVVKTSGIDGAASYHVLLADGVQQVGEPTAELLRLADPASTPEVISVPPALVAAIPRTNTLPVDDFPAHLPRPLAVSSTPVVCSIWARADGDTRARPGLLVGQRLPLPEGARPVALTSADGAGPGLDGVYVRPGSGEYVQTTGAEPDSSRAESLFYVSDSGVRFGIPDTATGRMLGRGDRPRPAPWPVLALLPAGPTLSRGSALVAHDGIGPDGDGAAIAVPGN
ncbi:MAG: type VII secretion protein EccB [Gordonia sp. (in: high G+C Gram-positive bacteria)]